MLLIKKLFIKKANAALIKAVKVGKMQKVKSIIAKAQIDTTDALGFTPLHLAILGNHTEIAEFLIENGANINAINNSHSTPLHYAIQQSKCKGVVAVLIAKQANINAKNKHGHTPLHIALICGHKEIIKFLIDNGANIHEIDGCKYTSVHHAARTGLAENVELLIANGANINGIDKDESTPLHHAASSGFKEIVELLIKNRADVNVTNTRMDTPLHHAIINRRKETAELLIANGANINTSDAYGNTPLHLAIAKGQTEIVELLIKNRADVNVTNTRMDTPLHHAIINRRKETAELLIANGANINTSDAYGNTPLHLAIAKGQTEIVKLLIANGANINTGNVANKTPLYLSLYTRNEEVAKLLIRYMFYSTEKPKYLNSTNRSIYSRCSKYWDNCNNKLRNNNNKHLLRLFKIESIDEQIKMWCQNEPLRNYCIALKALESEDLDLVSIVTSTTARITKKIFLCNNKHWTYLINQNLPLTKIPKDLANRIQFVINDKIQPIIDESARLPVTQSVHSNEKLASFPPAKEFINTRIVLSPPELKELALSKCGTLFESRKREEISQEIMQSSLLRNVSTPECIANQYYQLQVK